MLLLAINSAKQMPLAGIAGCVREQSHSMANEFVTNIDPVSLLLAMSPVATTNLRCGVFIYSLDP